MKIALVQCPAWGRQTPPLALSLLSAYLRHHGKEVSVFDINNELFHAVNDQDKLLWQLNNEAFWEDKDRMHHFAAAHRECIDSYVDSILASGAEVIGFSIFNSSKELSLIVAQEIKKKSGEKKIVLGGPNAAPHMSAEELIYNEAVDAIVIGEGEVSLLELLELAQETDKLAPCKGVWVKRGGEIIRGESRPLMQDLDTLPFADYSDYDLGRYAALGCQFTYFSRGCVNRCVYCNENLFWHGFRSRSGGRVHAEIKYQTERYPHVEHYEFADSLVNGNIKELVHFAELLIQHGPKITWSGQAVIRPYMTKEALRKLKASGCVALSFGMESGSQRVVDSMRKGFTIEDANRVIRETAEAGIEVVANFMFGFPGEEEEDFEKTLDFLERNRKFITMLNPSLAYTSIGKDTYLFDHAQEYNIELVSGPTHLLWRSKDGTNTFEIRQQRYKTFCKFAFSLGLKFSYPVLVE